ncbi:MAG: DUF1361 domain-containing protein [Caldilineales bacterium]|nr:DUF1361 domain-containing protein [Caldilineales bacterium]
MKDKSQITWTMTRLLIASMAPIFLLAVRMFYTGQRTYVFLTWNLFLAWLPLIFAFLFLHLGLKRRLAGLWMLAWFLFFPNAPYIITDMIHIHASSGINVLYDVVLLFTFAICGLALGFVSLRWMQWGVAQRFGQWWSRLFVLNVLALAGFGIFAGRFLRWNSWDAVTNPLTLVQDILPRLANPLVYWQTWAMSMLFGVLLIFLYWLLAAMPTMGFIESHGETE